MMNKIEVMTFLSSLRTNEIVVATMMACREWKSVTNNWNLDFPMFGCMGQAPGVGLGLAIARPDRKVWVLNGDGCQLMDMGSVTTIAASGVKNLTLFVLDNGSYETTGGQPTPGAGRVDYAVAARGLGISNAHSFDDIAALKKQLPGLLAQEGPTFIGLKAVTVDNVLRYRSTMLVESRRLEKTLAAEGKG